MIVTWNFHTQKVFVPSWISCLDDNLYEFSILFLAKVLIKNSYMNEKTCGSPTKTRKRKISYILDMSPTHANEYNKKGFAQKNINTNNKSVVGQIVKIAY